MKNVIISFAFLLILFSCRKPEDCPNYFELPIKIIPAKETYEVGDTLTFTSKFYKKVLAYNIQREALKPYDMSGIDWQPVTFIYRTDSTDEAGISIIMRFFDFIEDPSFNYKLMQYSEGSTGLIGEYNFENDTFFLTYRLIARKPGTFMSEFGSNLLEAYNTQDFPGNCNRNGFTATALMNDGADNNIDLLKESPNSFWNTWVLQDPKARFHKFGGYCFKVVQ